MHAKRTHSTRSIAPTSTQSNGNNITPTPQNDIQRRFGNLVRLLGAIFSHWSCDNDDDDDDKQRDKAQLNERTDALNNHAQFKTLTQSLRLPDASTLCSLVSPLSASGSVAWRPLFSTRTFSAFVMFCSKTGDLADSNQAKSNKGANLFCLKSNKVHKHTLGPISVGSA